MNKDTRTEGQVGRHGTDVAKGPRAKCSIGGGIDWPDVEDHVQRMRQYRVSTTERGDDVPGWQHRSPRSWLQGISFLRRYRRYT